MSDPRALLLPWIVLNPAGNAIATSIEPQRLARSGAAWTMAVLSWRWGFDGFRTYNVYPFETKDPNPLRALVEKHSLEPVVRSHARIAHDLARVDALMVAWGSEHSSLTRTLGNGLLKLIDEMGREARPMRRWCIGRNSDGNPRHASRIKHDRKPLRFTEQ